MKLVNNMKKLIKSARSYDFGTIRNTETGEKCNIYVGYNLDHNKYYQFKKFIAVGAFAGLMGISLELLLEYLEKEAYYEGAIKHDETEYQILKLLHLIKEKNETDVIIPEHDATM